MTNGASPSGRRRILAGQGKLARIVRRTLYVKLCILVSAALCVGVLYVRLAVGPLSFGRLPERVSEAIAARIGPGWAVTLRNTALMLEHGSPALRATELDIRNPEGALVLKAPFAIVSVDGLSLLTANLHPRSIEFRDLQLRALVRPDGSLTFVPTPEEGAAPAPADAPPNPDQAGAPAELDPDAPSPVSAAVGSLLDLLIGSRGAIGTLDRAQVTNARLTLVDTEGRERATFRRVDATFERTSAGGRRVAASFEGPQGQWSLNGDAQPDGQGGYRAVIETASAPVHDLLLLSGFSAVPATIDLKLSGRLEAAFSQGRVQTLSARLASNAGTIQVHDKDTSALPVDALTIDSAWDENRRTLLMKSLALKGGVTDVRLQGELTAPGGEPWRASLTARNAILAGAGAGDPPVRIDTLDASLSGRDGIRIENLKARGPDLSVDLTGLLAPTADPRGLQLDVHGAQTGVRHALRLWPEATASSVRRWLAANLKAGTVEAIRVQVAMTGQDIGRAFDRKPVPEGAVRVEFRVSDGELQAAAGLPPLSKAAVTGLVTGTTATVRVPTARVEMADGRALSAQDGTFGVDDFWAPVTLGKAAFRLSGGADGLAALLQAPLLHEIGGVELDPATVKGRTELRVAVQLPFGDMPKFADLPISVTGTIGDLSIDRIFGKEKLDGANLAVSYDRGALAIRGDGKLAGSPAAIDIRQGRDGPGEANVAFTLDDAARARKGMGFGSQLVGPVAIKASLPLGKDAKPGTRIEADLARAAVDGLIPGWQKPSGRPGKITLSLAEAPDKGTEIRDLMIEAGSVQVKGTALLSPEGSLEKADLPVFRLSQGDDMRAQVERAAGVYKVVLRGNVGDSRPFTRSLNAPVQASASRSGQAARDKEAREAKDVDLDLALNILTGHNDEAITNAVVKASLRKDTIRQLDVKGRLGSSNVMAQTVSRGGGNPVVVMQAEDAGAMLRFLDVYRRMVGGDLVLQLATGDGPQTGFVTLQNFLVRNEPALRRIIPTQSEVVTGTDRNGRQQTVRIDLNEVEFTRARVDFTRNAGRLDFKDAAIWGQAIGFTLSGYLDLARDRVDISGTFVPAYGLNNAFAQVPLFGPLLGGGRNEGLFAVNFRVAGQASTPSLSVNPLSAVAPGFLRKLFGAGGGEPPTGSVQTSPRGNPNN
jgi:hypothetical protein